MAGRLGFRDLASAVLAEVASFDTAFLRTFIGLTRDPGRVAREYIEGRRVRYMNPLKYALFAVTFYVVTAHLFGAQIGPPRPRPGGDARFDLIFSLLPYLMLLALLPAAALQKLLFRSSGDRVVECYVFGLFAYSHVSWLLTPLVLAGIYALPAGAFAVHGLRLVFWIWATLGFYRPRSLKVALKAGLVFLTFLFFTFVCAGIAGVLLYWWER
ncbi:MAG TPA: DUF3667 domain-containing protein [Thermoanaerobaculia bacterium]